MPVVQINFGGNFIYQKKRTLKEIYRLLLQDSLYLTIVLYFIVFFFFNILHWDSSISVGRYRVSTRLHNQQTCCSSPKHISREGSHWHEIQTFALWFRHAQASLGDLGMLTRLDLSFNRLFGSIPTRLADAPLLEVLDVQNNTLSGNVPPGTNVFFITPNSVSCVAL